LGYSFLGVQEYRSSWTSQASRARVLELQEYRNFFRSSGVQEFLDKPSEQSSSAGVTDDSFCLCGEFSTKVNHGLFGFYGLYYFAINGVIENPRNPYNP